MEIIVCLDNSDGMLFNHRRQSKDREVIEDIEREVEYDLIKIDEFSVDLFSGENFWILEDVSKKKGIYFVENKSLKEYENDIEKLIIYRWNRDYPADAYLDIDYKSNFKLIETYDFKGYSHERITKEIYVKK